MVNSGPHFTFKITGAEKFENDFDEIIVQNTGGRVEGRSASAMRKFAESGDLEGFIQSYPPNINRGLLTSIFKELKSGMKLNENYLDKLINDEIDNTIRKLLGE